MTCRLDTHWSYRGLRCLRLENELLAIDVLPDLGGKIYRLVDKQADRDLLWHSDRVAPHPAPLHADFDDHWSGGWDEIFPTGERSQNRAGEPLPHMGELWTGHADWRVLEDSPRHVEIALSLKTPITPAHWQRRISLEAGSPSLRLAYRIAASALISTGGCIPPTRCHRVSAWTYRLPGGWWPTAEADIWVSPAKPMTGRFCTAWTCARRSVPRSGALPCTT